MDDPNRFPEPPGGPYAPRPKLLPGQTAEDLPPVVCRDCGADMGLSARVLLLQGGDICPSCDFRDWFDTTRTCVEQSMGLPPTLLTADQFEPGLRRSFADAWVRRRNRVLKIRNLRRCPKKIWIEWCIYVRGVYPTRRKP